MKKMLLLNSLEDSCVDSRNNSSPLPDLMSCVVLLQVSTSLERKMFRRAFSDGLSKSTFLFMGVIVNPQGFRKKCLPYICNLNLEVLKKILRAYQILHPMVAKSAKSFLVTFH